jgi:hypothetical protein
MCVAMGYEEVTMGGSCPQAGSTKIRLALLVAADITRMRKRRTSHLHALEVVHGHRLGLRHLVERSALLRLLPLVLLQSELGLQRVSSMASGKGASEKKLDK